MDISKNNLSKIINSFLADVFTNMSNVEIRIDDIAENFITFDVSMKNKCIYTKSEIVSLITDVKYYYSIGDNAYIIEFLDTFDMDIISSKRFKIKKYYHLKTEEFDDEC